MVTVFRFIHYRDSFFKSLVFRCQKCWFSVPKCTIRLSMDISFCFCFPLSLSMGDSTSLPPLAFLWQPLALLGCHITPSPLCCLSSPPFTLSPSPCLLHCLFHSACVLSVVFCNGVIIGQPKSHFLQWAVCLLSLCLSPLSSSLFLYLFQSSC